MNQRQRLRDGCRGSVSEGGTFAGSAVETCAANRYPRRGIVSMYGFSSDSSSKAFRSKEMFRASPTSSTFVSGHTNFISSDFSTTEPRRSSRTMEGFDRLGYQRHQIAPTEQQPLSRVVTEGSKFVCHPPAQF